MYIVIMYKTIKQLIMHMHTLGSVAGLGVAVLHCGGFGMGTALVHRVQVPLLV